MDVYRAATERRSVRCFKDVAVPGEVLEKCVEAARLAPCGGNWQVLEYLVVDDEKLLPSVFDNVRFGVRRPPVKGVPDQPKAYIIILVNADLESGLTRGKHVTYYDIGLASENIMLVAWENGVGSCPLLRFNPKGLKQVLNIPGKYEIGLVLAMGYPDEAPQACELTDSSTPWLDESGERHVPKRRLGDIMHRNWFS